MNKITIEDSHDYVALSWVKDELVNTLSQAQSMLESLSKNPQDTSALTSCHDLLHQVSGVLHMVGFPGAALFAEEIKKLSEALINNSIESFNASLQILMQAILQIPSYLDIIQTEGHDIPIALLPIINEMRSCYKAIPLSEVELFSPKYHSAASPLTDEELKEINTEGLTNLLRKLRQSLQLSLIDLIHNRNLDIAFDHLIKIFSYLTRLCKATPISTLWRISLAFLIGISEKSIANTLEAKELLKKIDQQIKVLVEQGVLGMNKPAPETLIKNLLFLLAKTDSQTEIILAIKQEFHLDNLIVDINEVNTNQIKFINDRTALNAVTQALAEEFVRVKDQLDLITRSESFANIDLESLLNTLKNISNTLEMLGLYSQKRIINKQLDIINAAFSSNNFDKNLFIDIARAILDVETVVEGISSDKQINKDKPTSNSLNYANETVIKEAANELAKVKDILSLYFNTEGKEGEISTIPELLGHTAGALTIINQQRAAAIVIRCLQFIEERLINSHSLPDNSEINAIVGAIASIDYHMECLAENHIVSAKDAINFAIKYLYDLNYPLPDDYESLTIKYLKESKTTNEEPTSQAVETKAIDTSSIQKNIEPIAEDNNIDQELVEIFTEEMEEILEALSTTLPAWIANTDDKDSLAEVRRSFHTIKGSGRMVKATFIGELGWAIENMLNRVIDRTIPASSDLLCAVQDVVKILPELVKDFSSHQQHHRADVDYYIAVATALVNKQELPTRPNNNPADSQISAPPTEQVISLDKIAEDATVAIPINDNHTEGYASTDEEITTILPHVEESTKKPELVDHDFDVELIDIFITEAKTHMQALRSFLTLCERSLPQQVTDSLQRAMHTLKGSAAMAGLQVIANIAKPFEGFLKEYNINGWPIYRTDLELLQDAYSLLNKGIQQLELHSLAPVEGTELIVERINARRNYLLSQLEISTHNHNEMEDAVSLISTLLQNVDLLLDAEEYITEWKNNPDQTFAEFPKLYDELKNIAAPANQAGFAQITKLCNALLACYNAIQANTIVNDERFYTVLLNAHYALLTSIDQLAAAQVIAEQPEIIKDLEQIVANIKTVDTSTTTEPVDLTPVEVAPTEAITITKKMPSPSMAIDTELTVASPPVEGSIVSTQPTSSPKVPTSNLTDEDKLILGAPAPTGPIIASDDNIDFDMVEIFLEEADEILIGAKQNLDSWINNQAPEYLHSLQRQLHTLKGGARMCGASSLGDLAHGLEFIYEGLLNKHYQYSTDLVKLLTTTHDFIQLLVDNLHDNQPLPYNPNLLKAIQIFRQEGRVVFDELEITKPQATSQPVELVNEERKSTSSIEKTISIEPKAIDASPSIEKEGVSNRQEITPTIPQQIINEVVDTKSSPVNPLENKVTNTKLRPTSIAKEQVSNKEVKEQVKVSSELLDNLVNLAGETSIYRSRVEQQNSDLAATLMEVDSTIERVRDQLRRLDMETQSQIISKHQTENTTDYLEFDPLEMDQYSQIQQLSRSLFESASDLQDLKETLIRRNSDVEILLQQQGRVNTELQEGLMRTRMVPLERIAPRLRRLVRQISTELGKDAELIIGNTAGEMDRGVIDAIVAPLEHMIRNSLDHGIETRETRIAAGKPAKGTISLDLIREGGEMILSLKDDGSGISIPTIRAKAIAKGLMGEDEQFTDHEILQFILEAGFSTAKKITQISGRGVGLDVVVNAVKQLGGTLSLESEEGKGTTFSIRLPINLSVSRALMIRVGDDNYAIPMSSIEGVSYISHEQQKEFQQFGVTELEYGNVSYTVKYLGELLGSQQPTQTTPTEDKLPVLLVRSGDYHVALEVDELLPSSEIVVKSLGIQFLSVPAISGATILGDGHVIIILDLGALVRSYYVNQLNISRTEDRRSTEVRHTTAKHSPIVMVVDDSVTVRKVTTRLLERQGMQVIAARDGLDAVTQLEEKIPDIMLLDIEMPRMDGFEVATRVRHDEKTKHLPIIMITSRSGEKHRERALAIGVNEYMSKPFMDAKLIKSISDLLPSFEVNLLENN